MAFRHQIELTNEENIGSLTLKCGTFSTTCQVTYPEGNTDESMIPSSAGTGVDVECTIRIIISDPYQDPELATYSYAIEFYASGGSPDLSGISIEAPAYQPLKINEEESEFTLIRKPEHLYGWTDPNTKGQTLYAWTCEENTSGGYYNNDATYTIYTTTENPTTSSTFYDKDGNEFNPLNGTVVYDNEGLGNSYTINSAQIETTDGTTNVNFYTYIASSSGGVIK